MFKVLNHVHKYVFTIVSKLSYFCVSINFYCQQVKLYLEQTIIQNKYQQLVITNNNNSSDRVVCDSLCVCSHLKVRTRLFRSVEISLKVRPSGPTMVLRLHTNTDDRYKIMLSACGRGVFQISAGA